ncbi:MAG: TetR/AcrR family transcriptional regulator [Myxococcaceae bacterium]
MKRRKAGRPSQPLLDRRRLMATALELLEERGPNGVTMRALGQRLGVNPMAAYHYFESKEAVLRATAAYRYQRFRPRLHQREVGARLLALGLAYGRFLKSSRHLLGYLVTASDAALAGPVQHFNGLFCTALGSRRLRPGKLQIARNAFVDLVHGFALAGPEASLDLLGDELRLLILAIGRTR